MCNPPHLLHVFSTFSQGGQQTRTCAVLNALGSRFRHTITATDGNLSAADRLHSDVKVEYLAPPPGKGSLLYPIAFKSFLGRVRPDLLITYNWGAFDALTAGVLSKICPLIHVEDGFGSDEAKGLKLRRVLARRLLFNFIDYLAVPSQTLKHIALTRYRMPAARVRCIPNGVDLERFGPNRNDGLRTIWGIPKEACVFGFVGRLSAEKNLGLLLRSFANVDSGSWLVIAGDGPEQNSLRALAQQLGVSSRVIFAGDVKNPVDYYNSFDVFVLSSATEQMPVALLEAMACGLPAICTSVGDVASILGTSSLPSVVNPGDQERLTGSMRTLSCQPMLRVNMGCSNRTRVLQKFTFDEMVERYEALYEDARQHSAK